VVFVWVVATLRLHQVALFIELRQCAILGVTAGGDLRKDLHLLLVLSKLKLVGSQSCFFLTSELVCRLVLHLFLIKGLEYGHLILVNLLLAAQA
jgi:hypothetical protein